LTPGAAKRFKQLTPNHLSVAMLAIAGHYSLLLGADLERTPEAQFGWDAVLASTVRPNQISDAFKVAHHGSITAEHGDVWTKMLRASPIAVVTPFSKLPKPLPKDGDIKRLKGKCGVVYCTTWPTSSKPPRRKRVDAMAKSATKSRRVVSRKSGAIRLRMDLADTSAKPIIDTFGSAKEL
jgi:hypothetical protein